ncbi:hypothetical protein DWV06_01485 [Anaerosacchariphilus polymeriproducens]|uniref:Uncharacterized protein n=1 Tax=Anaerosacchariphilus polymeriproducens TaxID=1812858 RepID=A0A371AZE6_9FIRM|nr:hypothetical protein DWV06_01485 [Anaerosacchariphilus polymeriproducens]
MIHTNLERKPAHTLSDNLKSEIISIYNNKYWDTNFTREGIQNYNWLTYSLVSPFQIQNRWYLSGIVSHTVRTRYIQRGSFYSFVPFPLYPNSLDKHYYTFHI